jgi:hypothetical protein
MKDNSSVPVIERYGSNEESKFGIASAEDLVYIFDILRNKLYSDKILAVVREYCTNAADANVENGLSDRPIVVTCPTRMSPVFRVRDFGKGLSFDEIKKIYCMYGRSTKRNSNDYTGQLGLGSKSGFAYGDSFSITSFNNGKKTVYTAYIDESKLGAVSKASEDSTDEEPGIEISIPVKHSDISTFVEKIEQVYRFFKVKPNVLNLASIKVLEPIFGSKSWALYPNGPSPRYYNGFKSAYAVMGNIGYPIDTSLVFPGVASYYGANLKNSFRFLTANTVIHFDIGELSISASREELEYTESTINAIKNAAEKAADSFIEEIQKYINNSKDAIDEYARNQEISEWLCQGLLSDFYSKIKPHRNKTLTSLMPIDGNKIKLTSFSHKNKRIQKVENAQTLSITRDMLESGRIWVNDGGLLTTQKMIDIVNKNSPGLVYLLSGVGSDSFASLKEWSETNDVPLSYFKNISTHQIEPKIKTVRVSSSRAKGSVEVYSLNSNIHNYGNQENNWTKQTIRQSDVKVYVQISRYQPVINGVERLCSSLTMIKKVLSSYGVQNPEILGIKTKDLEKVHGKALSIESYVQHNLGENETFKSDYNAYLNGRVLEKYDVWSNMFFLKDTYKYLDFTNHNCNKDGDFAKLCEIFSSFNIYQYKNSEKIADFCQMINSIYLPDVKNSFEKDFIETVTKVSEKYPLIKFISSGAANTRQEVFNQICNYVNKIDQCF